MKGPVSTTWKLLCPDKSGALMLQFQTDRAPVLVICAPQTISIYSSRDSFMVTKGKTAPRRAQQCCQAVWEFLTVHELQTPRRMGKERLYRHPGAGGPEPLAGVQTNRCSCLIRTQMSFLTTSPTSGVDSRGERVTAAQLCSRNSRFGIQRQRLIIPTLSSTSVGRGRSTRMTTLGRDSRAPNLISVSSWAKFLSHFMLCKSHNFYLTKLVWSSCFKR